MTRGSRRRPGPAGKVRASRLKRRRLADVGVPEKRQNIIMILVVTLALVCAGRLVYVQAIAGPALAAAAAEERSLTRVLVAPRGDILDADGEILATSLVTYNLILDLNQVPEYTATNGDGDVVGYGATALAPELAAILGVDANELGAALVGDPETSTGRGYYLLARDVAPEVEQQVAALRIPGFTAEVSSTRTYPNANVAGPLLGWVNSSTNGVTGIELAYQDLLAGTDGSLTFERGAAGQIIPTATQSQTEAIPGCDVSLTIDRDIQYTAEQVVTDAVARYGASWGAVVVMETETGRILALADSGGYDPNIPPEELFANQDAILAPSYQAVYEPGSTGKVLTVLSALEEEVVTPTTPVADPYRLTVNGQTFSDHSAHPDQMLTTTGVLAESANTGTINIGSLMSDETRYQYMRMMGWGEEAGLGLVGDAAGILAPYDAWDGRQRYTTMFGQGVAVSLLQNTGVFNTIGNQGMRVEPRLVEGWTCEGAYTQAQRPDPLQVVSPESSEQMIRMLESVTDEGGTGTRAVVEGYRVAGKTGTAQTADGAGGISATTASFVGVVPADDPELTIGVVIHKPTSGFFGGTIAAPVFQDVAAFALSELGVAPSAEVAEPYPLVPPDNDAG
ncbi:MAG: peptidoglycan D,D-transpeptidase FtsI family protein [Beutenbergiaceae bacterium]